MAALGRIRPKDGTIDVGADATRRVASLLVEEGQSVKKDEILAYLDNHEEMQAAAAFAEAQYEGGKAQLTYRTALEQANIAKAEAELRSVEELTPLEIAVQELTVEKGRHDLELAQKEAKRLDKLVGKGSASREDLDKKSTEVAHAHHPAQVILGRAETAEDGLQDQQSEGPGEPGLRSGQPKVLPGQHRPGISG